MEMLDIIAGLAWDPEIRGFMAVLTGVVVLMGSVWLIISTNSGPRLGTLISLAGFFGWMAIMASVWWMYGIGLKGDVPEWTQVQGRTVIQEVDLLYQAGVLDEPVNVFVFPLLPETANPRPKRSRPSRAIQINAVVI